MAYPDASSSASSSTSHGLPSVIPRDARLIALILASTGVTDVEPAVLLQLLEFAHRYTYDVLSDALVYSDHANSRQAGSNLTLDDVNLAIQTRVGYSFTQPPEKDMLLALASTVNAIPLPPISDRHGVRLPNQEHCLTNVNFSIVPNPPPADFDDFEQPPSLPTTATVAANSQSTAPTDTQKSTLFDNTQKTSSTTDDYDADDADVSMTTVHPSQSQAEDKDRGTKRSLDEDDEYD